MVGGGGWWWLVVDGGGGRTGTTRVAVTIAVAVAVAIVDAVVVALAVPVAAIALAVVAVALAAVLVVAEADVFVGGDSRRCGWVTSCCVVVRLLAAREWVGWWAGCCFVVGYSCPLLRDFRAETRLTVYRPVYIIHSRRYSDLGATHQNIYFLKKILNS